MGGKGKELKKKERQSLGSLQILLRATARKRLEHQEEEKKLRGKEGEECLIRRIQEIKKGSVRRKGLTEKRKKRARRGYVLPWGRDE